MNVLFVTYTSELYGANLALYEVIHGLKDHYKINPYVLMKEHGPLAERLENDGIPIIIINFHNWRIQEYSLRSRLRGILKSIVNIGISYKIIKVVKSLNISLVHSNSTLFNMGYLLSKRLHVPHIWHLREFGFEDYRLKYALPKYMVKKSFCNSTYQIAISQAIYRHYVEEEKLCMPQNVKLIYDGIKIPAPYSKYHFENGNINFCVVGVISRSKNQKFIIEAFSQIAVLNNNIRLHIIGDGKADYVNELKLLTVSLGIQDKVDFWGYCDNVSAILKKMDVGVMASEKEAFGRVTVEYMSNYMPVLGVDAGATPEIIDDGQNGNIFTLNNLQELALLIKEYAESPEIIIQYGEAGRKKCEEYFSYEVNYTKTADLYNEILK